MIIDLINLHPERVPLDDQIAHIRENFDWVKVHDVMTYLGWTWARIGGVPSLGDVVDFGIEMLQRVNPDSFVSCGGFKAENYGGVLSLKFVVTEWDAWDMPGNEEDE